MAIRDKNISRAINFLREKPRSINEIAKGLRINWRTAGSYIALLKALDMICEKDGKFFLKDKDNYFCVPTKDHALISSIYSQMGNPTKTQAYKMLWVIDKRLNLGLPIGWYRYGPVCVQRYRGDETGSRPKEKIMRAIKAVISEYGKLDNMALQDRIYSEESNRLYLSKERLLKDHSPEILLEMMKYAPNEAIETLTDFTRTVMLTGWHDHAFETVWKYVTMIVFKKDLQKRYAYDLSVYFDKNIEQAKHDARTEINRIAKDHIESKHAQDSRYLSWKRKRQNPSRSA